MPDASANPAHIFANQVSTRLHQIFDDLVKVQKVGGMDDEAVEQGFLTRSLAALSLLHFSECNASDAAAAITDGGNDDGIDAVYVSEAHKKLYLVQSKWLKNTAKGIPLDEFTRFRDGVKRVINLTWDDKNSDLHAHRQKIEKILTDIDVEVVMVFAHTSEHGLSDDITRSWKEFLSEQNKFGEFLNQQVFTLREARETARSKTRPENISVTVMLRNFGQIPDPYKAVYGSVSAQDLVAWFDDNGDKLFAENLRFGIEKSEVNDGIIRTAVEDPQHFCYFNNGITAICDQFSKQAVGGTNTDSGVFDVTKISVINGAQTISSLVKSRDQGANLENVFVHMRIISLASTPENFSVDVTTANNTQNDLSPMDFVAADPNQDRLRREAAQIGLIYSYRRGDKDPVADAGFNLREATIAAACASGDLRLAVSAKRYISGLWENTKREPYTKLFNEETDTERLWRAVKVSRLVDNTLEEASYNAEGRERLVATHGNRFILFRVFEQVGSKIKLQDVDEALSSEIVKITKNYLSLTCQLVEKHFPDAYPGNIFKNTERQTEISKEIDRLG